MIEILMDQHNDKCCLIIVISCSASCQLIRYCAQHDVLQLLVAILWFPAVEMLRWQERKTEPAWLSNSSRLGQAWVPDTSHHMMIQHSLSTQSLWLLIDGYERQHHSVNYYVELMSFIAGCICYGLWISTCAAKCTPNVEQKHELVSLIQSLNCYPKLPFMQCCSY